MVGGSLGAAQASTSASAVDAGDNDPASRFREGWLGWKHDGFAVAASYASFGASDPRASERVPTRATRSYGLEIRTAAWSFDEDAEGKPVNTGGITFHFGLRLHRMPFTWDWGNCRGTDCMGGWEMKGQGRDGEMWGLGGVLGLGLYRPLAPTVRMFIGGAFQLTPFLPVGEQFDFDCNSLGACAQGKTPVAPKHRIDATGDLWFGASWQPLQHVRFSMLAMTSKGSEHAASTGYNFSAMAGTEVAW